MLAEPESVEVLLIVSTGRLAIALTGEVACGERPSQAVRSIDRHLSHCLPYYFE
jgi:hypothetical protein